MLMAIGNVLYVDILHQYMYCVGDTDRSLAGYLHIHINKMVMNELTIYINNNGAQQLCWCSSSKSL